MDETLQDRVDKAICLMRLYYHAALRAKEQYVASGLLKLAADSDARATGWLDALYSMDIAGLKHSDGSRPSDTNDD